MKNSKAKKWITLLVLCAGGGVIYRLPYLREVFYIPMQNAFHLTNFQMGFLTSMYGIVNFLLYIPGGVIADKFSYKILVPFSLIATGLLGFWYATIPSYTVCLIINGAWAITTVFTFWPTMVKAVRMLGDSSEQGKLFGVLEGGRGVASTIVSFIALGMLAKLGEGLLGIRSIIIFYSVTVIVIGIAAYFLLDDSKEEQAKDKQTRNDIMNGIKKVVKMPEVWLVASLVFTTYAAFSGLSFLTPYVTEVFKMSVSVAAFIGIIRSYVIMAFAPPIAGVIADKMHSTIKFMIIGFVLSIIFTAVYVFIPGNTSFIVIVLINMLVLSIVLLGMKGVFFAPLDEVNVPREYTGIAAGIVSFIGYVPDMFINSYYGGLLDAHPGITGYNLIFISMIVLCLIGLACGLVLYKLVYTKRKAKDSKEIKTEIA
ncbi:MFS transporter [Clostridium sp.]|uniref:MFS transporter n=1 Tax=Clostridium sp. TaxID=1506 RepID=UPI002623F082|nr:MFS transporter [Clostridium sp.]